MEKWTTRIFMYIRLVTSILIILFLMYWNKDLIKNKFSWWIYSWSINTWLVIIETWFKNDFIWEYTKNLILNKDWYNKTKTLKDFPKIRINNSIKDVKIIADITFTNNFINKYDYENSNWYFFALKFFLWDFDNGWYYNVYRKQNWWVWNSYNHDLVWAKLAYKIRDWVTWYIPLNDKIPVAVNPENRSPTYQYKYLNIEKYLNENIWKDIPIWVYLSSVKELKWWELIKIKELKIVYTGKEWDLEVIQQN